MNPEEISPRSHLSTLVLSLAPCFVCLFGLHRFYAGKFWTGLLCFVTFGWLGIGQVVYIIFIICGRFRDKQGRLIIG